MDIVTRILLEKAQELEARPERRILYPLGLPIPVDMNRAGAAILRRIAREITQKQQRKCGKRPPGR